jgi:hypothetical protein
MTSRKLAITRGKCTRKEAMLDYKITLSLGSDKEGDDFCGIEETATQEPSNCVRSIRESTRNYPSIYRSLHPPLSLIISIMRTTIRSPV